MTSFPSVPVGPYGMTDICYMGHAEPRSRLNVRSPRSATKHCRMLVVKDIDNKFADAWFDGADEELPLAEQWLLDMCNVLYGDGA